jgi:hypothetical protein
MTAMLEEDLNSKLDESEALLGQFEQNEVPLTRHLEYEHRVSEEDTAYGLGYSISMSVHAARSWRLRMEPCLSRCHHLNCNELSAIGGRIGVGIGIPVIPLRSNSRVEIADALGSEELQESQFARRQQAFEFIRSV